MTGTSPGRAHTFQPQGLYRITGFRAIFVILPNYPVVFFFCADIPPSPPLHEAVISAAVEVLYKQTTQLFPGNDDTVPHQVKIAIDPDAEIIYWFSPQPSTGYVSLRLGQ